MNKTSIRNKKHCDTQRKATHSRHISVVVFFQSGRQKKANTRTATLNQPAAMMAPRAATAAATVMVSTVSPQESTGGGVLRADKVGVGVGGQKQPGWHERARLW